MIRHAHISRAGGMARMSRTGRIGRIAVFPLLIVLAACGTQRVDGIPASGATPARPGPDRSAAVDGPVPDRSVLEARARSLESAMELIYVIDVPGFAVAKQSLGPSGDDGFQSAYVAASGGGQIHLRVDRGTFPDATCESGAQRSCRPDGDRTWYSAKGGQHEYVRVEDGHVVRLDADSASVDREVLRAALISAHRADDRELDALLPEEPARSAAPVERGDLPPVGDGAPDNEVNAGG
ncbi:hypothetical protein ABZ532_00500 [Streptomyces sp. NPDC019396]|uniref:hypothetical protein n=1 Tax=Streptomyces sp. NPDC019396 TaxID=3154687 RepID=UPI0033C5E0E7